MPKIASLDEIWIDLPLKEVPWRNMIREIPHWRLFQLFKVTLDTGHVGVGEMPPYYTRFEVTDDARQRVIGKHPAEVMWDDTLGCGLQMACCDAAARLIDAPVWSLLGEKVRDRAHVGWWAIDMPVEDWILECQEALDNGYTTFKTKARPWFDLENQLAKLCEFLPDHFKVDIDFNDFGLDAAIARPLCKSLERFKHLAIWESPILQEDLPGNCELRKHLSVPIAHHAGRPDLASQIQQQACDGFVLEAGISWATKTAATLATFNKPFWLQWTGTNLAAFFGLHLQAVMTHCRWPAIHCHHMYTEQYVQEPFVVENGMASIPEAPGIGVTIDWDVVEKYRTEPQARPFPHPGLLLRIDWPSGTRSYFAHTEQMWAYFRASCAPAFTPGVHLVRVEDDGSDEWRGLFERVQSAPVHANV